MSRTPTLFGSLEARRRRHDRMVELRERGWSLVRIAEHPDVDVWAGKTVQYHLSGRCRCYRQRNGARASEEPDDER